MNLQEANKTVARYQLLKLDGRPISGELIIKVTESRKYIEDLNRARKSKLTKKQHREFVKKCEGIDRRRKLSATD